MADTNFASGIRSQIQSWRARNKQIEEDGARKIAPFFKQAAQQVREEEGYRKAAENLNQYARTYLGEETNYTSNDVRTRTVQGIQQDLAYLGEQKRAQLEGRDTQNIDKKGNKTDKSIIELDEGAKQQVESDNLRNTLTNNYRQYLNYPEAQTIIKEMDSVSPDKLDAFKADAVSRFEAIKQREDYTNKVVEWGAQNGVDTTGIYDVPTYNGRIAFWGNKMKKRVETNLELEGELSDNKAVRSSSKELANNETFTTVINAKLKTLPEFQDRIDEETGKTIKGWYDKDTGELSEETLSNTGRMNYIRTLISKYEGIDKAKTDQYNSAMKLLGKDEDYINALDADIKGMYADDPEMRQSVKNVFTGLQNGTYLVNKDKKGNEFIALTSDINTPILEGGDAEYAIYLRKEYDDYEQRQIRKAVLDKKTMQLQDDKINILDNIISELPYDIGVITGWVIGKQNMGGLDFDKVNAEDTEKEQEITPEPEQPGDEVAVAQGKSVSEMSDEELRAELQKRQRPAPKDISKSKTTSNFDSGDFPGSNKAIIKRVNKAISKIDDALQPKPEALAANKERQFTVWYQSMSKRMKLSDEQRQDKLDLYRAYYEKFGRTKDKELIAAMRDNK